MSGIVEPEEMPIARRRIDKHIPTAKNTKAAIDILLGYNKETTFSM
jgi:hypothetical protein